MSERFYWENGKRVPVVDPDYDTTPEQSESRPELAIMRTLMAILQDNPDRLTIDCLSLISSLCYSGDSMADIARKHYVTRATVSNRCVELCDLLGVPPVRAMRNESARENSRKARNQKTLEMIEEHLSTYYK